MGLFNRSAPVLYVEDLALRFNQMCPLWNARIVDDAKVGRSVLIDTDIQYTTMFFAVNGRWHRENMKVDSDRRVISSQPQLGWYSPPVTKNQKMAEAIRGAMVEVYREAIVQIASKPDRLAYRAQESWLREAYEQLKLSAPE